jgi:hypothetical protein
MKSLFWLTVLEILVNSSLALLVWGLVGQEDVVDKASLPHG